MSGGFLTIGTLTLQADAAWFTITKQGILGGTGRIFKTRIVWTINGYVRATPGAGNPAAQVDSLVLSLEAAAIEGADLVFSIGSSMKLLSAWTTEGTHVRSFEWLTGYDGVRGSGAEGLLRRSFRLVMYGDILSPSDTALTFYSDSMIVRGNGLDKTVPVPSLSGTVQAQTIMQATPVWVIQSGRAVGETATPYPATPLFIGVGYYPEPEGQVLSYFTPKQWGRNQNTGYGISWSYTCWLPSTVSGYAPPGI